MDFYALLIAKGFFVVSLGLWLFIAACNNLVDPETNIELINRMLTMTAIHEDLDLGLGLRDRAIVQPSKTRLLLKLVAIYQLTVAILLILSGSILGGIGFGIELLSLATAIKLSTISVLFYASLWVGFLLGGMWFGYWIKMGRVQIVHFILLILSLLVMILVNMPNAAL